jgi:hypothetical protein
MEDFFKTVWSDIKQRKNLELYLALFASIIVLIVDIVGVETRSALMEVILVALAVLIYGLIDERHSTEEIERKLDDLVARDGRRNFFTKWSGDRFNERLKMAESLSLLAVANQVFLSLHIEHIKQFLRKGGTLRCILVKPQREAMKMAADRSTAYEKEPANLVAQTNLALEMFREIAQETASEDRVEVRFIDHLPSEIVTIIDGQDEDGTMFVSLYGFEQPPPTRPSFVLHKQTERKWFEFFRSSFENLWNWQESEPVDL